MRLLHLSDLHLGRRLCEADLFEDQKYILDQIVSIALSEGVQGVLVAGDVYDKGVPGVGHQRQPRLGRAPCLRRAAAGAQRGASGLGVLRADGTL